MAINLEEFETQLDEALAKETKESNDIIFAYKCEKCGAIIYTRE